MRKRPYKLLTNLLNCKSGDDILPEFTHFYKTVFQPNTVNAHSKHKAEVDAILIDRLQHQSEAIYNIDINDILYNISKLKKCKAEVLMVFQTSTLCSVVVI